jgi:riboflavin kinase/FMN adenylyltransferase
VLIKLLHHLPKLSPQSPGSIVGIGNFDGVHRGHQEIIRLVLEQAMLENLPAWIITFEPQPKEYFSSATAPARLTTLREKSLAMQRYGVEQVICLQFNAALANLAYIVVGEDFHFGKQRAGNVALLKELGNHYQFDVLAVSTLTDNQQRVSSTRAREALATGDLNLTAQLLGRPYTICGRVMRGDARGRLLGFPTANIYLGKRILPVSGVFAVRVFGLKNHPLYGVANAGTRPTVDGTKRSFEVHLFDFDQDIYGQHLEIELVQQLRGEKRFDTLELLIEQIGRDVKEAKKVFGLRV